MKEYVEPLVEIREVLWQDVILTSYDSENGDNLFGWDLD